MGIRTLAAPGVSSGEAIKLVEEIAAKNLPGNYQIAWTAQAYQEKRTGSAAILAFSFAIIMVFLILMDTAGLSQIEFFSSVREAQMAGN